MPTYNVHKANWLPCSLSPYHHAKWWQLIRKFDFFQVWQNSRYADDSQHFLWFHTHCPHIKQFVRKPLHCWKFGCNGTAVQAQKEWKFWNASLYRYTKRCASDEIACKVTSGSRWCIKHTGMQKYVRYCMRGGGGEGQSINALSLRVDTVNTWLQRN